MSRILSFFFIILWSSAFITGKVIVNNGTPFASLSLRFAIVALGFFLFSFFYRKKIIAKPKNILESLFSGILFHGVYLGGCFYSFAIGVPASVTALIVSMQPILTNFLAGPILNEKVTWKQWIGIFFGFFGTIIVLGYDIGNSIPVKGVIVTVIALIAVTIGTLWQKKLTDNLPLSVNNFYQAIGASIFLFFIMLLIEKPFINLNSKYILAMSWQILAVSFGAFTILMYLIKVGSTSKTSTLFFLVPPVSAFMAWFFLNENISLNIVCGLIMSSLGVFIATKK